MFVVVLFSCLVQPCQADLYFSDNFDDGNADGWWLGPSHHGVIQPGTWRIENGSLLQDAGSDHHIALVENLLLTDQSIETQVKLISPTGYGGITVWYHDFNNWIEVYLYPHHELIGVMETINGSSTYIPYYQYPYISSYDTWYDLRVDVDSVNEELSIYLNNTYFFTYNTITPYRTGLSGITTGNDGAYIDNFQITPVPGATLLGVIGLSFSGWLLKRRKML